MPDFEAVGDAITGGVVGRAVEPRAGEGDGRSHENNCLNCGTALIGGYCHACGQHAHVHRTLSAFFHDFLHGVLHFEGKIWRTLPMLAWNPGQLTRRYIDGQRAKFVSPIALFLFCVFLLFATVSFTGEFHPPADNAMTKRVGDDATDVRSKIIALEIQRSAAVQRGQPTTDVDERLSAARSELETLTALEAKGVNARAVQISGDAPPFINKMLGRVKANPDLFVYKLKMNAYKFSWALIPISVPFVWLLFPFSRRFRLYDHTIFVTYSLSFMTILFILYLIVEAIGLKSIASLASFLPPIHMYRQLRGTYDLSQWSAAWRTVFLVLFALVAISLFVSLLVSLGAFD